MKDLSIYIHIPFCESKCNYCDFTSFVGQNHKVDTYIACLIKELSIYKDMVEDYEVKTIFIGGGTPSSIDGSYIYKIMEYIHSNFNTKNNMEITIESNPGSLSREKIKIYREAGINRLSMGAQSFNQKLLDLIGRTHSLDDIYRSIYISREGGFNNINLDLMLGLPGQTMEDHMDSLKKAVDLGLEHISNYSLILEEGTSLYNSYRLGKIDMIPEELDREMYHRGRNFLSSEGYNHYEISNYAKKGLESTHNLVYWDIGEYLGVGLSSHSNLKNKRFNNTENLDEYLVKLGKNSLALENIENISKEEEISEYCIMGFRKIKGIGRQDFKERFNIEIDQVYRNEIEKNIKRGLIKDDGKNISLTIEGLDLMNLVELDFFR